MSRTARLRTASAPRRQGVTTLLRAIAAIATLLAAPVSGVLAADEFEPAVQGLADRSFAKKQAAIERLATIDDPRVIPVLSAMREGNLYVTKNDERIVIGEPAGSQLALTDAVSGESLGTQSKGAVNKIIVNNRLRNVLSGLMAQLRLSSADPALRLAAAKALVGDTSEATVRLLRQALETETDASVAEALEIGLAAIDIASPEPGTRMAAVQAMAGSLRPEVRVLLDKITAVDTDGKPVEPDESVRAAALEALESIDLRVSVYKQLENLFFGLSLGSVLLLAAVGLAITFGVMGVINMAHGEMVMLGAYTTYVVQLMMPELIDYSLFVAIPAAFVVTALVGIAIEQGIIRHLYGRPLETLLATFGVSLILQQAVRTIFSPLNRAVITPSWMSGSLELNPVLSLTYNRLYIVVFSLIVLLALMALLSRTRFGLQVRAVTQNRPMARAMGIRTGRIDALTFALGSGVAGMGGVALSQLTNVGPNMGQAYIIDSFMVVVFGGVGSLLGTFSGAMTLGIANKFLEPATGSVLAKILILTFIIIFIQRRPRGLFALKGRAAED